MVEENGTFTVEVEFIYSKGTTKGEGNFLGHY